MIDKKKNWRDEISRIWVRYRGFFVRVIVIIINLKNQT